MTKDEAIKAADIGGQIGRLLEVPGVREVFEGRIAAIRDHLCNLPSVSDHRDFTVAKAYLEEANNFLMFLEGLVEAGKDAEEAIAADDFSEGHTIRIL